MKKIDVPAPAGDSLSGRERDNERRASSWMARRGKDRHIAQPSRRVIVECIILMDCFVITIAAIAAQWIYIFGYLGNIQNLSVYATVGILGAVLSVASIRRQNIYEIETLSNLRGQASRLILGLSIAFVALLSVGYLLKISANFSRGWMFSWFVLSFLGLVFSHYLVARILRRWKSFGLFARNVAIYGSGDVASHVVECLGANPDEARIFGVFDDLERGDAPNPVVAGDLSDLIRIGQRVQFDEVIVALPSAEQHRISDIVMRLSILPAKINLCADILKSGIRPVGFSIDHGVGTFQIIRAPMDNWAPILKSIEDRVLSCIALLLAAPIMLVIALAIRLDSPGAVFFRQRRHGFNHQIISVLKFRTMTVSEDGPDISQARRNDPRVTRVGKFLRHASLDELPQLFNVLLGDMSLVGPRPHAIAHNEYYSAILETYAVRHKVKPGITGWAQVCGCRGETDTPDKMRRRIEHDIYYIENWSIWFDIKVLMLTPFYGLFGKNAF